MPLGLHYLTMKRLNKICLPSMEHKLGKRTSTVSKAVGAFGHEEHDLCVPPKKRSVNWASEPAPLAREVPPNKWDVVRDHCVSLQRLGCELNRRVSTAWKAVGTCKTGLWFKSIASRHSSQCIIILKTVLRDAR